MTESSMSSTMADQATRPANDENAALAGSVTDLLGKIAANWREQFATRVDILGVEAKYALVGALGAVTIAVAGGLLLAMTWLTLVLILAFLAWNAGAGVVGAAGVALVANFIALALLAGRLRWASERLKFPATRRMLRGCNMEDAVS
ncbi:MAG: hypothetical protein H6978_11610 [Gammaproteobacteria bacterium]|nr:hypothetical protein [Gammaproteobacteria bacterium]